MTEQDRRVYADKTSYKWTTCALCGRSEKDYYIETGWAMLLWLLDTGESLCECCYANYPD